MKPVVYATFVHFRDSVFRKEMYIQWGDATTSLGSVVLCHPSHNPLKGYVFTDFILNERVSTAISANDRATAQIIRLVEAFYADRGPLNGRISVYFILPLQIIRRKQALIQVERMMLSGVYSPMQEIPSVEQLKRHPWILCAWGHIFGQAGTTVGSVRDGWMNRIRESAVPYFGIPIANSKDFYHVRPLINSESELRYKQLLVSFQELMQKERNKDNKSY
ncbi:MAG: hypothetical protein ACRC5C_08685 [Bacilli bacterium]